jgi:hypothetical protein
MAEVGSDLYVADTGNHLIRKIDRKRGMGGGPPPGLAGTGSIGYRRLTDAPGVARDFA